MLLTIKFGSRPRRSTLPRTRQTASGVTRSSSQQGRSQDAEPEQLYDRRLRDQRPGLDNRLEGRGLRLDRGAVSQKDGLLKRGVEVDQSVVTANVHTHSVKAGLGGPRPNNPNADVGLPASGRHQAQDADVARRDVEAANKHGAPAEGVDASRRDNAAC